MGDIKSNYSGKKGLSLSLSYNCLAISECLFNLYKEGLEADVKI